MAKHRASNVEWLTFGQAMKVAALEGMAEVVVGGEYLDLVESLGMGAGVGMAAFGIRAARRWRDRRRRLHGLQKGAALPSRS